MFILNPKPKQQVLLASLTTFRIGGPAKYFTAGKKIEDFQHALDFALGQNLPYFILGQGSNILVADQGFEGLVIKTENKNCFYDTFKNLLKAEAGLNLGELLNLTKKLSLTDLEWVAGIPGTVGGAIWGNAGAYGSQMSDFINQVTFLDQNLKIVQFASTSLNFSYRQSIFKKTHHMILDCDLKLRPAKKSDIENKIKKCLNLRREYQPLEFASAGCVFKNPSQGPAAKFIEDCGLKGKRIGDAMISSKHANFIVNLNQASASEVRALIKLAKDKVQDKFGFALEEEIQYLGFQE